jgi:hypothetical protein
VGDFELTTPDEVVAKIRSTPPNPSGIRPATASLADALSNAPDDPSFDLQDWTRRWIAVEGELKSVARANDVAEGRGT